MIVAWSGCAGLALVIAVALSTFQPHGHAEPVQAEPATTAGSTAPAQGSWQRAAPGRVITLPADHAAHPAYRLEWWYYTGNLQAGDGRSYGYQVTFFRVGVDPAPVNPSIFACRSVIATCVMYRSRTAKIDGLTGAGSTPTRKNVT